MKLKLDQYEFIVGHKVEISVDNGSDSGGEQGRTTASSGDVEGKQSAGGRHHPSSAELKRAAERRKRFSRLQSKGRRELHWSRRTSVSEQMKETSSAELV